MLVQFVGEGVVLSIHINKSLSIDSMAASICNIESEDFRLNTVFPIKIFFVLFHTVFLLSGY